MKIEILNDPPRVSIYNITHPISQETNEILVPDIIYHENSLQTRVLYEMIQDFKIGQHLLLIGNQGVGKNKIVDKFLSLLNLPREYLQLSRDSSVFGLTSTPSLVDGVLVQLDSPLVRAVINGYILVVDEADKAPTHVTCILKSLVEDGEMLLGDGRRIVKSNPSGNQSYITIHPAFRMFVLANRPGFPFLGNDFYSQIGDVFACHCVENPDTDSELAMLIKYGPNVEYQILVQLTNSFNELRALVDEGLINYPYSTRELVSVVKHLERYPDEGLPKALANVFDFDDFDNETRKLVENVFAKNGIPMSNSTFNIKCALENQLGLPILIDRWIASPLKNILPIEKAKFTLKDGWQLKKGVPITLDVINGRSSQFSELLFSFKIPLNRGETSDMLVLKSGQVVVISSDPVYLFIINESLTEAIPIELYEFFPSHNASPKLVLVETINDILLVINQLDGKIMMINISNLTTKSISMVNIAPKDLRILTFASDQSRIVVFQRGFNIIHLIDFKNYVQFSIRLPFDGIVTLI